jgi:RNase H-like domain found in reverse transcriptase
MMMNCILSCTLAENMQIMKPDDYDIQTKEILAIVWCRSRVYRFIYGAPFTIQTDCCALIMLQGNLSNNVIFVR